ncbi:MAG: 2-C-methyl-D-erythritol 4-phosphate cytidylyltransferase [Ruminococcus sp.]|nr:2-C-methyl-D-erythritol 4-phosphate cytidylyltransferase [Ruminococcus sp.]
MKKAHCTAIVLAAGQGRRMGTKVHKQYLMLDEKPVLYYSLKEFQDSDIIDEIYLITGAGEEEYCRQTIVDKYHITKVTKILPGGAERYNSVWSGLQELGDDGYVFIHDGARPFVDGDIIQRAFDVVCKNKACVVGMPVKDTIKVADARDFVENTPDRRRVWMIQTPQVFKNDLVKGAYSMLMRESYINVTDDAMVVEQMLGFPIKLVCGSYENIKITTPEDLEMAEVFLKRRQ